MAMSVSWNVTSVRLGPAEGVVWRSLSRTRGEAVGADRAGRETTWQWAVSRNITLVRPGPPESEPKSLGSSSLLWA